jgi:hypothetical protein
MKTKVEKYIERYSEGEEGMRGTRGKKEAGKETGNERGRKSFKGRP